MDGGEKKEVRRPMNAFLIFCKRHRGFVREKNPDMDNRSVTRVLGDLWANLGEEKKIYTNLAKQNKEAFMKANPNYKWHSADKSQCSTSKMINKPTNSRVIKNVADMHTDGSIIPGKLADPEKMGGLNLLLMADKETCESRSSSSAPSIVARTSPAAFSLPPVVMTTNSSEQSAVSNSALLQLAEMCTSELRGSIDNSKSLSHHSDPHLLTQTRPPSSLSIAYSTNPPMPPPKKRVRHWSLTEADAGYDTPNDSSGREDNILLQNSSSQKLRCTSAGSTIYSEDKYLPLEKYKSTPRRKLSSSATESIPSPSGPFIDGVDDGDSSVFSPEMTKSEDSFSVEPKCENRQCHDLAHGSFQLCSESASKNCALSSEVSSRNVQMGIEGNHLYDQSHKNKETNQAATPLQLQEQLNVVTATATHLQLQEPLNVGTAGLLRSNFWQEREKSPLLCKQLQHTSSSVPLYSGAASETSSREMDGKSERIGGLELQNLQEHRKAKSKVGALSPSSSEFCPSRHGWMTDHSDDKRSGNKNTQNSLTRFESASDTNTSSESRPISRTCSLTLDTPSFSSILSEGRIASILNNPDASSTKFPWILSNAAHRLASPPNKCDDKPQEFIKSLTRDAHKTTDQSSSHQKMASSVDIDKYGLFYLQTHNLNTTERGNSAVRISSTNQSQTFSKGKLKKKWTERMLTEAMLKDNPTQQQIKESDANRVLIKDGFINIGKRSQVETDANQNIEAKTEFSKMKSLIDNTSLNSRCYETADLKISAKNESSIHCSQQDLHLLNQPPCSLVDMPNHTHNSELQSFSGHTKLIMQLAQNQQTMKRDPDNLQTDFEKSNVKLELDSVCGLANQHQDKKFFLNHQHCDIERLDRVGNDGGVLGNKQAMNQITACGKKIVDRIVEQFCKTDFSGDKQFMGTQMFRNFTSADGVRKKCSLTEIKTEPHCDFGTCGADLKKENTGEQVTVEQKAADSLVGKLINEVCSSGRKVEYSADDGNRPNSNDKNSTPVSSNTLSSQVVKEESSRKLELCRQATSPPNDACFQNQWSAVTIESCDHSDINEDTGIQPVRKSRRANRGQKYQELIKEGFIQPSRERLAARNADRHGRSFGSREEFEKMEMKRTLKRSASEKDPPSESLPASINAVGNAALDGCAEKRFASGDFDLEKEIESLPVCSLDQLDKKKVMRRRCDSDTLASPSLCHRNNGDVASSTLSRPSSGSAHAKVPPSGGSVHPIEVDMSDPGCPAPHILLPKEERPTEPITGSRKRKARKHCITRISVLDEKSTTTGVSAQKSCLPTLSSSFPQKRLCGLSDDSPHTSSNKTVTESSTTLPPAQISVQAQPEIGKQFGNVKDFNIDNKVVPRSSLLGNATFEGKAEVKPPIPAVSIHSSIKMNPAVITSSSQPLFSSTVVPSLKAAFLLPPSSSDKRCESQPVAAACATQKKNKTSLMSSLSAHHSHIHKAAAAVTEKTLATGNSLKSPSVAPALIMVTDRPVVTTTDSISLNSIKNIISEVPHNQLITVPNHRQKTKIPTLANKELPKKKSPETKTAKITVDKIKTETPQPQDRPQSTVLKTPCALKRKFTEKKVTPIFSKSSNTPLVSALLGHSDLSSVIKLAEKGQGKVTSLPRLWSGHDTTSLPTPKGNFKSNSVISRSGTKSARIEQPSQILSAQPGTGVVLKTQFIPLNVGNNRNKSLKFEAGDKDITSKSTSVIATPTTKIFTPSSESLLLNERLTFTAAVKGKPRLSVLVPTALAASATANETAKVKPLHPFPGDATFVQVSGIVSQLQPQHVSLVAASSTLMTSDLYRGRTFASTPYTCTTLHNSLLSQVPSATFSSSSSSLSTNNCTFVSSASQPHSSPSTSMLSSPTVISLATSTPSTKSDIVSYTVIGSSSVIDAGSPHMIGSPHLPESPSVAIVQS